MSFARMVGHRPTLDRLQQLVASGRVPSSLLFTGPDGVGKRLAAVNLAMALNCTAAAASQRDACDACQNCVRIARGEFPDVRLVEAGGKGGQVTVDTVRPLGSEIHYRPFEGKKRVYIFDDAERMNPHSANTLLKMLEEPPPWTILILVTAHEAAILPTLLSRCQRVRFGPLTVEEVAEILVHEPNGDRETARLAAALSGGSVSRGLSVRADDLSALRGEALEVARLVLGQEGPRAELLGRADRLSKNPRLVELLRLVVSLLRDLAAQRGNGPIVHLDLSVEIGQIGSGAPLETWLDAYLRAEQALYDIETRYTNKRTTLESLFLALAGTATANRALR